MHRFKHSVGGGLRNVPPSNGKPNAGLRLIQRPKRAFITHATIATGVALRFRCIERNAADSPAQLGCKIAILPLNDGKERASDFGDFKGVFENRESSWIVHAPTGAIFMTPEGRALTRNIARWQKNCAAGQAQSKKIPESKRRLNVARKI